MKYYYFPSTFFRRAGGKRGGALRGCGYMVAGTLKGGVADIQQVDPAALAAALPKQEQALINNIENSAQPAEVGKSRWNIWNALKDIASGAWTGTKELVGLTADSIGKLNWSPLEIIRAYNELRNPQKAWERLATKGIDTVPAILGMFNPFGGKGYNYKGKRRKRGCGVFNMGVGGGRRLRKGSPEAKAYMARLRAMRRRK